MKILTGPKIDWANTAELVELPVEEMREFVLKDRPLQISHDTFSKLSKEQKDEIKVNQCGWFLFGVTDTGSRVEDSKLIERDALVFDIEHDVPNDWIDNFIRWYDKEAWYYTTMNHTPTEPR